MIMIHKTGGGLFFATFHNHKNKVIATTATKKKKKTIFKRIVELDVIFGGNSDCVKVTDVSGKEIKVKSILT